MSPQLVMRRLESNCPSHRTSQYHPGEPELRKRTLFFTLLYINIHVYIDLGVLATNSLIRYWLRGFVLLRRRFFAISPSFAVRTQQKWSCKYNPTGVHLSYPTCYAFGLGWVNRYLSLRLRLIWRSLARCTTFLIGACYITSQCTERIYFLLQERKCSKGWLGILKSIT